MKLGLSLAGVNATLRNLENVDIVIDKNFKQELVEQGKRIRDKAKQILEEKSAQRTNKKYWTGKLQEAIKLTIGKSVTWGYALGDQKYVPERREALTISIGPDMRTAPYTEFVEIGHYLVAGEFGESRGGWWEGYHYLEGAYTQIAPEIPAKIAETAKIALNQFGRTRSDRTRHLKTGRFVAGWGGVS